jgi:hypothetical protein
MTISFNLIRFQALAAGTASFGVGAADAGCVVPENAYVTNGKIYTYTARSDGQYEYGSGVYDTSAHTLSRVTVYSSSSSNAKVNFLYAPIVDVYPSPQPVLEPAPTKPPRGHIFGMTLSSIGTSATFGIAAGECADVLGSTMLTLPSAITKTTGAWVAGSGNGALDTGSIAINTWYHVFLIEKLVVTVPTVDVMISTNLTPLPPTGYTLYRRIGSIRTNGSSQWVPFSQNNDEFIWDVGFTDLNTGTLGTSAVTRSLTVPIGIKVDAILNVAGGVTTSIDGRHLISPLDKSDESVGWNAGAFDSNTTAQVIDQSRMIIRTNTLGQIRTKSVTSAADVSLGLFTQGWIDTRGRLS